MLRLNEVPHSPQNRAVPGFSVPHFGQCMFLDGPGYGPSSESPRALSTMETRTLSVAIYDRMQALDDGAAGVMSATLLAVAVGTLMVTAALSRRLASRRA